MLTMRSSHDVEDKANTTGSLPGGWAAAPTNATMRAQVALSLTSLTTSDQSCTLGPTIKPQLQASVAVLRCQSRRVLHICQG